MVKGGGLNVLISVKIMSLVGRKKNVWGIIAAIDNCIDLLQDNLTLAFVSNWTNGHTSGTNKKH